MSATEARDQTTRDVIKALADLGGRTLSSTLWLSCKGFGISYPGYKAAYGRLSSDRAIELEPNPKKPSDPFVVLVSSLDRVAYLQRAAKAIERLALRPAGSGLGLFLFSDADSASQLEPSKATELYTKAKELSEAAFDLWEETAMTRLGERERVAALSLRRKVKGYADQSGDPQEDATFARAVMMDVYFELPSRGAKEMARLFGQRELPGHNRARMYRSLTEAEIIAAARMGELLPETTVFFLIPPLPARGMRYWPPLKGHEHSA